MNAAAFGTFLGLTIGFGVVAFTAERYHTKQFERHTLRLEAHAANDDPDGVAREIERFHADFRIDFAIALMQWCYPFAVLSAMIAAMLALL